MSTHAFDAFTRHAAAAVSRRTSLVTLGGAALAATVAKPGGSQAKKSGTTCKKKAKKKCNQDAATCRTLLPAGCFGDAECIALLTPCCDTCLAGGFLSCYLAAGG